MKHYNVVLRLRAVAIQGWANSTSGPLPYNNSVGALTVGYSSSNPNRLLEYCKQELLVSFSAIYAHVTTEIK